MGFEKLGAKFQRIQRKGRGILIFFLILGFIIGYQFGFMIGAEKPTDDFLTMVYSSEKAGWIGDLVEPFKQWYFQTYHRTISVNFVSMGSFEMIVALQTGEIKPTLWSPASELQVGFCNALIPSIINYSNIKYYIYSPTVIGVWANSPYTNITGFEDLREKAMLLGGLRFAHTDPRLSNSGYTGVMMEIAAYFNYTTHNFYNASRIVLANLTGPSHINDDLASWLRDIEHNAKYYGTSTGYLEQKAKTDFDVFYVYENNIIDLNEDPTLQKKAIAIYPKEGLFLNKHPFCILNAPWLTPHDIEVAKAYLQFLGLNSSINQAIKRGFRPLDLNILKNLICNQTFNRYFNAQYGVSYAPPMVIHGVPTDPLVLKYVPDVWLEVRAT